MQRLSFPPTPPTKKEIVNIYIPEYYFHDFKHFLHTCYMRHLILMMSWMKIEEIIDFLWNVLFLL